MDKIADPNSPNGVGLSLNIEEVCGQITEYFLSTQDAKGTVDLALDYCEKLFALVQCGEGVEPKTCADMEGMLAGVSQIVELVDDDMRWKKEFKARKLDHLREILQELE